MKLTMPLVGVPLCKETGCTKIITIKKKTDTEIIVDIDSKTIHAPYSETFSCRESWIVLSVGREGK